MYIGQSKEKCFKFVIICLCIMGARLMNISERVPRQLCMLLLNLKTCTIVAPFTWLMTKLENLDLKLRSVLTLVIYV